MDQIMVITKNKLFLVKMILIITSMFYSCGINNNCLTIKKMQIPLDELKGKVIFASNRDIDPNSINYGNFGIYLINNGGVDSKKISPNDSELYIIDMSNGLSNISEKSPVLSGNGDIYFLRYYFTYKQKTEIWSMNIDGNNKRKIISNIDGMCISNMFCSLSPDNKKILFSTYTDTIKDDHYLVILNNMLEKPCVIKLLNKNAFSASWSPDGKKIVFQGLSDHNKKPQDLNNEIFLYDIDSRYLVNITNNLSLDAEPAWSPDGKSIAFVSGRNGGNNIYTMDEDGKNVIQIDRKSVV